MTAANAPRAGDPWTPEERATALALRQKILPPLDTADVLWLAAIDRVPIEERVEWVETMTARVAAINAERSRLRGDVEAKS